MKKITPIDYEAIIIKQVSKFYQNFMENCVNDFYVPEAITKFFNSHKEIKKRVEIDEFCEIFHSSFSEWKLKDIKSYRQVALNYFMSNLFTALLVLKSIDVNLQKENLEIKVITNNTGLDILVATAVEMVGKRALELIELYKELNLKEDPLIVFKNLQNFLVKIVDLSAVEVFSQLISNMIEYNYIFKGIKGKLSEIEIDEFSDARLKMFIAYLDTHYLFAFMLRLVLIYPLDQGLLEKSAYDNIVPNVELY